MSIKEISLPEIPDRDGKDFDKAIKERFETIVPIRLPLYTFRELSDVKPQPYEGSMVRCSNGNAGEECIAYCNGVVCLSAWG